jgi:hypothetical protein
MKKAVRSKDTPPRICVFCGYFACSMGNEYANEERERQNDTGEMMLRLHFTNSYMAPQKEHSQKRAPIRGAAYGTKGGPASEKLRTAPVAGTYSLTLAGFTGGTKGY